MNYSNIYTNLIINAQDRCITEYTEIHHILPKCMGGSNELSNLIHLTAREHFIAHLLLAKIYGGKLWHAAHMMSNMKKYSSRIYKRVREEHARVSKESQMGKIISEEVRKNMSLAHQGQVSWAKGKPFSDEHKENISNALTGRKLSDDVCKKMSSSKMGHITTKETRQKISAANKGKIGHMTGKTQTAEARNKISLSQKGKSRGHRVYKEDGTWTMVKTGV